MFLTAWVLASARLLLKNTVVRSSRVAPSSFVSFNFLRKSPQGLHLLGFELLELLDLGRVLAVVRQVVVAEGHARYRRHTARAQQLQGYQPRGIGLQARGE